MIKQALRAIRRSPGVSAVAIVSLALGTGANIAIFSIFNQALLRPLPVPHSEELVTFTSPGPRFGRVTASNAGGSSSVFSYPMLRDLEEVQTSFVGIAAHRDFPANMSVQGQAFADSGLLVTGNYFDVLKVQPALGRFITQEDARVVGDGAVAVLSDRTWRSRFGADPLVLNSTLTLNGEPLTIVGVAPAGFQGTTLEEDPSVFVPLTMAVRLHADRGGFDDRNVNYLYLFARLKPGVSIEQASTAIQGPFRNILALRDLPLQTNVTESRRVQFLSRRLLLHEGSRGEQPNRAQLTPVFLVLFVIAGTVLVIAAANIANLLLARTIHHNSDLAVRISLGASRAQLMGQVFAEAALIALFGALAGIAVGRWTLDALSSMIPSSAAGAYLRFALDGRMLGFVALASFATALLSGALPALYGTRLDLIPALRANAGTPSGTRASARLRSALASAQIALSMGLLVIAVLFARSLYNIGRIELGMDVTRVSTFLVAPQFSGYTPERSRALYEQIEERLLATPGVRSVGASTNALLAGDYSSTNVRVEGFNPGPDADTDSYQSHIGPGLFATLGVPLVAGREFTVQDTLGAPKVAVVNEAFARKFNLGRGAVGKRMRLGGGNGALDVEIVGLLSDAKYGDLKDAMVPQFYVPYRQDASTGALTFYVRTSGDPSQTLNDIRRVVASVDPQLPVVNLRTMAEQVGRRAANDRLLGRLSLSFALLATFLAAIGLYGVLAYAVAQRTREIGLRIALGADTATVRRFVLGHVGRLLPAGLVIGAFAAVALGRLAGSMLFGVTGTGTGVILAAAATMSLVSLIAATVPMYRASRIDPIRALRYD